MKIDFPPIVKALKEENYSGYFTMESPYFFKKYTKETALDGAKELATVARRLADLYEAM